MPINQYEDRFAKFFVGTDGSVDLFAEANIRQSGSANLLAEFSIRYGVADLKGVLLLRQINSPLFAEFWVRNIFEFIEFDQPHKWIKLLSFTNKMQQATIGHTEVIVQDTIPENTPQTGTLALATLTAIVLCFHDFHNGHNWAAQNQQFGLISTAGTDTLWLTKDCANRQEVVDHINDVLANGGVYNHFQYMHAIVDPWGANEIGLLSKTGFEGESYGFELFLTASYFGHPGPYQDPEDALWTLGIAAPRGTYMGLSDEYRYSSWSGQTFTLTTPLTKTYAPNPEPRAVLPAYPTVSIQYRTINMLEVYRATMEWVELQVGIDSSVPLSAQGKAALSESAYTDIIYTLNDGWKLKLYNGDYDFEYVGTTITDDGSTRTAKTDLGRVDVIFNVSSYATVIEPVLSESDLTNIADIVWSEEDRGTKVDLLPQMQRDLEAIRDVERGRWLIKNNQMLFYDEDIPQATLVAVFNLYDSLGVPAEAGVVERVPADFEGTKDVAAEFVVNQ